LMRLRKIEGQVRGIARMVEEGQDCAEVLNQLRAARKAFDKVGFIILASKMKECMAGKGGARSQESAMEEAMSLFLTLS
jgi:CsoR family transcriptional regulator, copper-sensing transcriptional repressor